MIEILHRYTNAVLYRDEEATTVREAMAAAVASREAALAKAPAAAHRAKALAAARTCGR